MQVSALPPIPTFQYNDFNHRRAPPERPRRKVRAWHSPFPNTGTAPLEASSGQVIRHRLSRAGDRKLNHALYMMAMVQVRRPSAGQTYYRRKLAEGKSPKEALRCLKRRLSDAVYRACSPISMISDPERAGLPDRTRDRWRATSSRQAGVTSSRCRAAEPVAILARFGAIGDRGV